MCIVCNCPPYATEPDAFLSAFSEAQQAMRRAEAAMLAVADVAVTPETKSRYKATHKQMVRLRREWNRLQETREHA